MHGKDHEVSASSPPAPAPADSDWIVPGRVPDQPPSVLSTLGYWLRNHVSIAVLVLAVAAAADFALWTKIFSTDGAPSHTASSITTHTPSPDGGQSGKSGGPTTSPGGELSKGISARSALSSSGALQTNTRIGFDHPISSFWISVPGAAPASISPNFDPRISHLQVLVAGRAISGVPQQVMAGRSVRVVLPAHTQAVELAYQATGVISASKPSKAGRALMLATPLRLSVPTTTATTISLQGSQILNLGCWSPTSLPKACGEKSGDGWKVSVPARSGVEVVAQINVPTEKTG